jgi:integrase
MGIGFWFAGGSPGEIFAITWGQLREAYVDIRHRLYRGRLGTPKTDNSYRQAALSEGLLADIEAWKAATLGTAENAWVFSSERMTPISKDNTWFRIMRPRLATVGLEWANFQVMRRTHSSLMKELKVDPKIVADQLGHTVEVNQNVYTQTAVEIRQAALNQLERQLLVQ